MSASINELLRKGVNAAREGDKATARDLFQQVVDLDEKNEKGWFWLASVAETDTERRVCLENVLHINPANERAQQILRQLDEAAKKSVNQEEVIPGVTRSQLTMILGGGIVLIALILIVALVAIISNNNRIAAENTDATNVAAAQTGAVVMQTATAEQAASDATGTAVSVGGTQTAEYTPPPTVATEAPLSQLPTLPPTWTPRAAGANEPTALPTLPPPTGLSGRLAVWSGIDVRAIDFLDVGYYEFSSGNAYSRVGGQSGRNPTMFPNGLRVMYSRYDQTFISSVLEAMNLNGTQLDPVQERWRDFDAMFDPDQPSMSRDGRYVTFIGRPAEGTTNQVWLLDMQAPAGTNPIKRLSDDEFIYSYPSISPDNKWVVAVRTDNFSATTGTDLILIDTESGGKIPVTNDLTTYTETNPRFTADGSQIIYAAYPSNNPGSHDIYIKNAQGTGTAQPLITDPADDIFPVVSRDGRYVAFASNRTGNYDIFIFDTSGGTLWQLTSAPYEDYPGDWWQP